MFLVAELVLKVELSFCLDQFPGEIFSGRQFSVEGGAVYLAGNFLRESFPYGQMYRVNSPGDLRGNFICLVLGQI